MKNKIAIPVVFAVLITAIYSCSPSNSSQLQGQWKCVSAVIDITQDDGSTKVVDFMKTSKCEKPNTSTYTFDETTKSVTIVDVFSCKEDSYKGSYKWLNEENDIELTVKESNSVTLLHVVSIDSDSLIVTTGEKENPALIKMAKIK